MTLNELKAEVAALGFEREMELDNSLLSAVNRSLKQIFTERNAERIMRVFTYKPKTSLYVEEFAHSTALAENFRAVGRAFAFRSYGTGSVLVLDEYGERVFDFSGNGKITRAFVKGEATISFSGDFCYTVRDLSVLLETPSDRVEEILPKERLHIFSGSEYDTRFVSFTSQPCDEYGNPISNASIRHGEVIIPGEYGGVVNIPYKYHPVPLTLDDGESEIDIPIECEGILALLVASYVWLDDDAAKAQYYFNMFREGMNAVKYYNRETVAGKYLTNGWA